MNPYPKRLMEVDLPIKKISEHARREKSIRHGHISTLHIWWARRPLAACRAVICAALWPDPGDPNCPERFKTEAARLMKAFRDKRGGMPRNWDDGVALRQALLDFIADFANWDNSTVKDYLETSRALTQVAHESLGGEPGTRPLVVDPFAGGGSIPLEALRVGADAFASDLNPIPILLNKIIIEYIPKYGDTLINQIRESAFRITTELKKTLDHFYHIENKKEEIPYAYIWARTITCEGPICGYRFPLLRSLWLSQKSKNKVALALKTNTEEKLIEVDIIDNVSSEKLGNGTSKQGAATCPVCGYTTPVERVRVQLSSREGGTIDAQLLVVAVTSSSSVGKKYRLPSKDEIISFNRSREHYIMLKTNDRNPIPLIPNEELNHLRGFFNVVLYGMKKWGDLFNPRQALLMANLVKLIQNEYECLIISENNLAEAVTTCLALMAGKVAQYNSSCCRWKATGETLVDMFGRQAIPMVWDFTEAYPFNGTTGDYSQ